MTLLLASSLVLHSSKDHVMGASAPASWCFGPQELDQMSSWPFEEDAWEDKGSGRMSTTKEGFGFVVLHELSKMTGMDTVPQIFVGGTFLGGCEELQRLQQSGRLIQQIESAVQA
ncbi:GLRX2, partial [Symbiodinium microadriaticum]